MNSTNNFETYLQNLVLNTWPFRQIRIIHGHGAFITFEGQVVSEGSPMNAIIGGGAMKDFTDGVSASLYLYDLCTNFDLQEKGKPGTMPVATVSADLYFPTRVVQDVPLHPSMVITEKENLLTYALIPLIQQVIVQNLNQIPSEFIPKKVDEMIRIGKFNNIRFNDYDKDKKSKLVKQLEQLSITNLKQMPYLRF